MADAAFTRTVLRGLACCAFALLSTTASAVTLQEIVALSKAGVSSQVILTLLERDGTVFNLTSDQIAQLKVDGVSEVVLVAMLRSAAQEPRSSAQEGPTVVVVGSGPDRPNTAASYPNGYLGGAIASASYLVPYFVPVPYFVHVPLRLHSVQPATAQSAPPPTIGTAPIPVPVATPASATGIFFGTAPRGQFFSSEPELPILCFRCGLRAAGSTLRPRVPIE